MASLNGFGIRILSQSPKETFVENGQHYVALKNGSEYQIRLENNHHSPADVSLEIEGEHVGKWRIPANDFIVVKRPAYIDRKFTFFRETSNQAYRAGITIGGESNGLVKATFYPKIEYRYESLVRTSSPRKLSSAPTASRSSSLMSFSSGSTILGDQSEQRFGKTDSLRENEINWDGVTTIYLRLVAQEPSQRYVKIESYPRRSPYPRRIEEIEFEDEGYFPY
ncbi:hypothetical protein pv_1 [Pithovirus sibericum]|uniref:Uncharacterized protein n=1 Tax=Pithovirus sibericum TaxID=1450746 RepID=W5S497_9VIRU|nr:hypothetical protein pv_1 [Pithovirus sibericum]AHH01568.1 hypothetical protein pv_1 [Pithovirus sibericum]WIL05125.1 hypothetical protein pmam_86 [Pithovirus mammoth]